jgi:hypothetical protein
VNLNPGLLSSPVSIQNSCQIQARLELLEHSINCPEVAEARTSGIEPQPSGYEPQSPTKPRLSATRHVADGRSRALRLIPIAFEQAIEFVLRRRRKLSMVQRRSVIVAATSVVVAEGRKPWFVGVVIDPHL